MTGEGQGTAAVLIEEDGGRVAHAAEARGGSPAPSGHTAVLPAVAGREFRSQGNHWFAPLLVATAIVAWTIFFGSAHSAELRAGAAPAQWADWIVAWSVPVLLVLALWLLSMRGGGSRATELARVAQSVAQEAALIEQRMAATSRELVAVQEAVAGQAQALEALGHAAAERLSQNARALQEQAATAIEALNAYAERQTGIADQHLALLAQKNAEVAAAADAALTATTATFEERMREAIRQVADLEHQAAERLASIDAEREHRVAEAGSRAEAASAALMDRLAQADSAIAERREKHLASLAELDAREEALARRLGELATQLEGLAHQGHDTQDRLEDAGAKLAERLSEGRGLIDDSAEAVQRLTRDCTQLFEVIQASARHGEEDLPNAISAAQERLDGFAAEVRSLGDVLGAADERGAALAVAIASARNDGAVALDQLDALKERLEAVRNRAAEVAQQSSAIIGGALQTQVEQSLVALNEAAGRAGEVGQETARVLHERMAGVETLLAGLEQRLARARAGAADPFDQDFARRMALIAETLNSTAVDLSRVFAQEISDSAWESYLRGDRGMFTRKALRLLDRKEARALAETYRENGDFRAAANRYLHDFEAMLRSMLSTADGHRLAVTLLSSDVGKLYVALAQATERLRA